MKQKKATLAEAEALPSQVLDPKNEVLKLKTLAKRLHGFVENIDREQQRVLCDLLVDRVELSRRPDPLQHRKWLVQGRVILRFGKPLYFTDEGKMRTVPDAVEASMNDFVSDFEGCGKDGLTSDEQRSHRVVEDKRYEFRFKMQKRTFTREETGGKKQTRAEIITVS